VWGILGWHIQLYHTHMNVTPPLPRDGSATNQRIHWHQDSDRLNRDLETNPRPRVSIKIGYFLTDTTEPGRGNFLVIPGSHLWNELPVPPGEIPEEAVTVRVPPGTAVYFDRRLWHTPSPNRSEITRKVLFYGYSYRWLRPRDDMTVAHLMERCDPIRRQLLGASPSGGHGYTSPTEEDVPLRGWLREHLGEAAAR
jgi:ectoine hydroxylase-related dioxygenase (phytanoyl-CoA dioxygenase family)